MLRPDWVPAPVWVRLEAALCGQPAHAHDLLADLEAATRDWSPERRLALLDRVLAHAEHGVLLPAAFIRGLSDLLEGDG
jgi:hypothetical protein